MNDGNKENKDTLNKTFGGFSTYDAGRYKGYIFRVHPNEAKILNIQPGEYSSSALANVIIKNTPYLGSKVLQKLYNQESDKDMLEILTGDTKKGEGLGFARQN